MFTLLLRWDRVSVSRASSVADSALANTQQFFTQWMQKVPHIIPFVWFVLSAVFVKEMPSSKEEKQTGRSAHFVEQLRHLVVLAQAILVSATGQNAAHEVNISGKVLVVEYNYATPGNWWSGRGQHWKAASGRLWPWVSWESFVPRPSNTWHVNSQRQPE